MQTRNLLIPVAVIFIGVMFLLGNMGIIPDQIFSLWPVVLVVAGLIGLSSIDLGTSQTTVKPSVKTSSAAPKKVAKSVPAKKKKVTKAKKK